MTHQETTEQRIQLEAASLPPTRFGEMAEKARAWKIRYSDEQSEWRAKYPWLKA